MAVLGRWNLPNGCEERRVWQKAFFCDLVAQIADLFCGKSSLLGPQFKISVPESLKDLPESSEVFLPCGGEDDDVIQIKQARFPVEAREEAIREAGEGGGCIAKTKWDLIEFVQLQHCWYERRSFPYHAPVLELANSHS